MRIEHCQRIRAKSGDYCTLTYCADGKISLGSITVANADELLEFAKTLLSLVPASPCETCPADTEPTVYDQ